MNGTAKPSYRVLRVSDSRRNWELDQTGGEVVEQVIRPTGLVDPEIFVVPARGQVQHLMDQIRERAAMHERVLITDPDQRSWRKISART
jgi:excinuclease ABC subunit B